MVAVTENAYTPLNFVDPLTGEAVGWEYDAMAEIAQRHGEAVGIAHPSSTSYTVLKEMLPEIKRNVRVVPASRLVRIIG